MLSYSQVTDFRRCRRLYHYRHILKLLSLVPKVALERGKLVSRVLSKYYAPQRDREDNLLADLESLFHLELERVKGKLRQHGRILEKEDMDKLVKARDNAKLLLEHYHDFAIAEDDFAVVSVEQRIEGKVGNNTIVGKPDALVLVMTDLWCLEHKTVSEEPEYLRLQLDEQSRLYCELAEAHGTIYNFLIMPRRRGVAATYKRVTVPRTIAERYLALKAIQAVAEDMVNAAIYPSPAFSCFFDCEFAALCIQEESGYLVNKLIDELYEKREVVHEDVQSE